MLEGLRESAELALHGDNASFNIHRHAVWDFELLLGHDVLHLFTNNQILFININI